MDPPDEAAFPGATLMILGAARCGTSSIHELYRLHPAACASAPKEPFFFEAEYARGLDYYRRTYFAHWRGERVVVEARVANLLLPYVPPRILASFPEARFVVSLREPAERAFSHWALNYTVGLESRPFVVAIAQARERFARGDGWEGPDAERSWRQHVHHEPRRVTRDWYLEAGCYAAQLRRYFACFPRERFCILTMEELRRDPGGVARRLMEFAGLDPALGPDRLPAIHGSSALGARLFHRINVALGLQRVWPEAWRARLRALTSHLQPRLSAPADVLASLRELYAPHDRDLCALLGWTECPWACRGP